MLAEAKTLYTSGNYPAARQLAEEAKAGKLGVDSQADELLAQIGLAEQGGALSLYESALSAMRNGENARARALLTEVAAAGGSLDESLQAKVQELLKKLPADDRAAPRGKAVVGDKSPVIPDAEALAAQKLNAEVGTKIAEARRLQETDPDKAIAIYEQTMKAVKASGLSPNLMRPMVRRLEVAVELAKKDKVAFEVKMQDKQQRAEIELKRLRILEADKAKKGRMKELMDKAQAAYAEGNYVDCEAYAKKAAEVDPNEVAATMLVFKARMERRYKQDLDTKAAKEEGTGRAFQEVDLASVADPEVQVNAIKYAKNFKDLTRERLRMNQKLEVKKDPKVLAIEAKLKEPISLNVDKQPLSEAITFLQNYTGLNIVLDPKALSDEGLTSAAPVSLTVNNVQIKTALKLLLRPLGLTYKVEDEVLLITSPQASTSPDVPEDVLRRRPDHAGEQGPAEPAGRRGQRDGLRRESGGWQRLPGAGGHGVVLGTDSRRPAGRRERIQGRASPGGHDPADPAHHHVDCSGHVASHRQHGPGHLAGLWSGPGVWWTWRRRWCRRWNRRAAASSGGDHSLLPQHQPDHPPHGGGSRADCRPAAAASAASGPPGRHRGPVHHRHRQLLRADRRRLRLLDPVRLGRKT